MPFNRDLPYNQLPLLPPQEELETKAVLRQAVSSSRALAELKGAGDLIPNQSLLLTTLALKEAKISSEIEDIVTTNDELYQAYTDEDFNHSSATKEVLHYNEALWFGYNALLTNRPLSTRLFEEIGQIIKPTGGGIRKLPGTKIANSHRETIYTPPEGEQVIRDLLGNLENFLYDVSGIDPLIKMAVMHYQFEAVHPFTDGNGRTGRILNILYLVEEKLLSLPILYLSSYIIENKAGYYQGLQQVTEEKNWEGWILYMLKAVEQTATSTKDKIVEIQKLIVETGERIRTEKPKLYSKDLLELLFRQPYCKIKFLEQEGIAARETASNYLKQLESIGLLQGIKRGREWYYLNIPFFEMLTR
jgi:Fic family protein